VHLSRLLYPVYTVGRPFALLKTIVEGEDYVLVHEKVWDLLQNWYGGGPEFKRRVVVLGIMVSQTYLPFQICGLCQTLIHPSARCFPVLSEL